MEIRSEKTDRKWTLSENLKRTASFVEAVHFTDLSDILNDTGFTEWLGRDNFELRQRIKAENTGGKWPRHSIDMYLVVKTATAFGEEEELRPGQWLVKLQSGKFIIMSDEMYNAMFADNENHDQYIVSWDVGKPVDRETFVETV